MATELTTAALVNAPSAIANRPTNWFTTAGDYWPLTKPEVNFLILITTFVAFHLASSPGATLTLTIFHTLAGTLLVASGAATLNQFLERSFDAKMRRTARRPWPRGDSAR